MIVVWRKSKLLRKNKRHIIYVFKISFTEVVSLLVLSIKLYHLLLGLLQKVSCLACFPSAYKYLKLLEHISVLSVIIIQGPYILVEMLENTGKNIF